MKPDPARLFEVLPYEPVEHGAFVRSTFALNALCNGSAASRARLDRYLELPGAWAVLARSRGDSQRFAGWAARTPDALIFAYVIDCMRGRWLASMMLYELGFDERKPIPLLHWTPSAQEVAARSGRVFYAPFPIAATATQERATG